MTRTFRKLYILAPLAHFIGHLVALKLKPLIGEKLIDKNLAISTKYTISQ
jgi:hypothetical protein